jgi:hypothetical protein
MYFGSKRSAAKSAKMPPCLYMRSGASRTCHRATGSGSTRPHTVVADTDRTPRVGNSTGSSVVSSGRVWQDRPPRSPAPCNPGDPQSGSGANSRRPSGRQGSSQRNWISLIPPLLRRGRDIRSVDDEDLRSGYFRSASGDGPTCPEANGFGGPHREHVIPACDETRPPVSAPRGLAGVRPRSANLDPACRLETMHAVPGRFLGLSLTVK